jgi:hypothetical protein
MTAPDRSIEDAALIAFVRELRDTLALAPAGYINRDKPRLFTALLSRLEGRPGQDDATRIGQPEREDANR